MNVEFHPEALAEVETAQAWYEERSLLAASGFLKELSTAVQRIREAPQRYPPSAAGTRRVVLERFPFTIYYRTGVDIHRRRGGASEASSRVLDVKVTRPSTGSQHAPE